MIFVRKIKCLIIQHIDIPSQRARLRNAIVFSDRPDFLVSLSLFFLLLPSTLLCYLNTNILAKEGEKTNKTQTTYLKCWFTKIWLTDSFTKSWLISCLPRFLGHLETSGTFVKYLPVLNGTFLMNPGSSHTTMTFGKDQLRVKKQNKEIHKGKKKKIFISQRIEIHL